MLCRRNISTLFLLFLCLGMMGCASKSQGYSHSSSQMKNSSQMHKATMRPYVVNGKKYYPTQVNIGDNFSGIASWYGEDFHGNKTSNGEIYNMYALTAAHKILPMNTMVKVTNLLNDNSLVVRINDRGPFAKSRIIDLSYGAAKKLGFANKGTAPVRLEVVGFGGRMNGKSISHKQSISIGNLLVQVGAFRNKNGAIRYGKDLRRKYGKYYELVTRSAMFRGSKIHRVYLRGFKSEEEAKDFIESGHLDGAFILRDE